MNKKYLPLMEKLIKIVDELDKLNSADNSANEQDDDFINNLCIITKSYYFNDERKINVIVNDKETYNPLKR